MMRTPFSRAFLSAGTIALVSLGTMRIVLAPAATMFSTAVTWLALSVTLLPAAVSSLAPLVLASAAAPSFIATKNGLVSVLVIRPMTISSAALAMAAAAKRMLVSAICRNDMNPPIGYAFGRRTLALGKQVYGSPFGEVKYRSLGNSTAARGDYRCDSGTQPAWRAPPCPRRAAPAWEHAGIYS